MTEENNLMSEANEPPPAAFHKTKEQWLEEGKKLALYAPQRFEEGLTAFEQAISLDPGYVAAWWMKGYTLRALKRYQEALAAFEHTISLDAAATEAYNGKGSILFDLKLYDEALLAYDQAIRLDATSYEAFSGKAISLVFLDRQEEALAAYEQVILHNADPAYTWIAYLNSGTIQASFAHYEEALAAYQGANLLEPNDASIWRRIGDVLTMLERIQEAHQAYEKARQLGFEEEM